MHLFRKAGASIGDVLPGLLRAVVGRLASARLPSLIQVSQCLCRVNAVVDRKESRPTLRLPVRNGAHRLDHQSSYAIRCPGCRRRRETSAGPGTERLVRDLRNYQRQLEHPGIVSHYVFYLVQTCS
jgi:hypothetical protein